MTRCHYVEEESIWLLGRKEAISGQEGGLGDHIENDFSGPGDRQQGWVVGVDGSGDGVRGSGGHI